MRLSFQAASLSPQFSRDLSKISPDISQAQWQSWQQAGQLFCCIFNQRVVAYCVISPFNKGLKVQHFKVRDITRRRGIGLFMFQQLLQFAQEKQLARVTFPNSKHLSALAFYQQLGLNAQFEFQL